MEENKTTESEKDVKTKEEDPKKEEQGKKNNPDVIPYDRFKEVVTKKNELMEKLAEYESKLSKVDELINQQKEHFQSELDQYKEKYKNEVFDQFKVVDKEFVEYKVNKLLEENKDLDLKSAIKKVKESNPNVFEKKPGQGTRGGTSPDSKTITYDEYVKLPKSKRLSLIQKGIKVI